MLLHNQEVDWPAVREQDCRAARTPLAEPVFPGAVSPATRFSAPAFFSAPLTSSYSAVFNPLNPTGVWVLDHPLRDMLLRFQQPHSLGQLLALAPQPLPASSFLFLASAGLLNPVPFRQAPPARPTSLTAWLHLNNNCNLACAYCYVPKTTETMSLAHGRQAIRAIFRSARNQGIKQVKLKYAGGEASLRFTMLLALHDFARELAETHDIFLDGVVLSNGVAWNDAMFRKMISHRLRLMLSLDGLAETHDPLRPFPNGRGSFSRVEHTLDLAASHNLRPSIAITLTQPSLATLPAFVAYLLRRNLIFSFNFYRDNDFALAPETLALSHNQLINALRAAFTVIEQNLPPYSLLDGLLDRTNLVTRQERPCGLGQDYVVINQQGSVAKCHMHLDQTVTHISTADILEVVREDKGGIQNISVDNKIECRHCTWRYQCGGGCPAATFRQTGRFDLPSPYCRLYKSLLPDLIRLEGLRLLHYNERVLRLTDLSSLPQESLL